VTDCRFDGQHRVVTSDIFHSARLDVQALIALLEHTTKQQQDLNDTKRTQLGRRDALIVWCQPV